MNGTQFYASKPAQPVRSGRIERWVRRLLAWPPGPARFRSLCLITGTRRDVRCGVEDYAVQLGQALAAAGIPLELLRLPDWSLTGTLATARAVRAERPALIHLQYPTLGYGRGLGPHLLALLAGAPFILTLHEYWAFGAIKRASLGVFALSARHIIFTTDHEREQFLQRWPNCRARSSVIPIGSNIPFNARRASDGDASVQILFFGQLRPGRGLETFLAAAKLASAQHPEWRFSVLGARLPDQEALIDELKEAHAELPIEWHFDLAQEAVATELAQATIAYIPYPDGVSGRRGTLLAALGNGAVVITTDGPFRPHGIEHAVRFADSPQAAVRIIAKLIERPDLMLAQRAAGYRYARRHGWGDIAAAHSELYQRLGALTPFYQNAAETAE